ncbi:MULTISPECIES: hypothetical protein [Cupriavidus]|uniref:hypothetical protein n=1 Tax=Cupriavidus sp. DF5525 TaxID=3160989 RepID=UPI00040761BA
MAKLRWLATVPAVTAPAVYTVTGANSVDNVQALLTIEVAALAVPPAGLAYVDPLPEYIIGVPIVYNEPVLVVRALRGLVSFHAICGPLHSIAR